MVYGRQPSLPMDVVLVPGAKNTCATEYGKKLADRMETVFKKVTRQQRRMQELNRLGRDSKQARKSVSYQPGDAVLCWGPVTKGAMYKSKAKLLYKWSAPCVVHKRVSELHYTLLKPKEGKQGTSWKSHHRCTSIGCARTYLGMMACPQFHTLIQRR